MTADLHRDQVQTFFKAPVKPKRNRKRVNPVSEKRKARNAELAKARGRVLVRSQGMCEARILEVCTGRYEEAHHRRRRSQGGSDHESNLLACCEECHRWIHANPSAAMDRGFLVGAASGPEPESSAVVKVEPVPPAEALQEVEG